MKEKTVMNEIELFKEFLGKLKEQNNSNQEFYNELQKVVEKFYNKEICEKDILEKYLNIRTVYTFMNYNVFNGLNLFDVVNGIMYNEKEDTFELYPFKVLSADETQIELLGLKFLDYCTWETAKNKSWIFIFQDIYGDYANSTTEDGYFAVTGRIPNKNKLMKIVTNYSGHSFYIDYKYNIIAIGDYYWTDTQYNDYGADAWAVGSNGAVDADSTFNLYGALPYVVIGK